MYKPLDLIKAGYLCDSFIGLDENDFKTNFRVLMMRQTHACKSNGHHEQREINLAGIVLRTVQQMFNAIMPVLVEQIPGEAMCDKNKNDKVV